MAPSSMSATVWLWVIALLSRMRGAIGLTVGTLRRALRSAMRRVTFSRTALRSSGLVI